MLNFPIVLQKALSEKKGGHDYDELTCACKFDCGCWVLEDKFGGPNWVNPFGKCPMNPKARIKIVSSL